MLDLTRLRSFAEVAERGTIAAAARSLGFTAPAISQHLGKLEAELGTPLFDRVGRGLRLSAAGAALLPVALDMIDLETRARHVVHDADEIPHLVVAGFASALSTLVVPVLPELDGRMTLDLVESEDVAAMRDLGLGAVDLVLAQEYSGIPEERNPRFEFAPLLQDDLRLVLPAALPKQTRVKDLGTTPWLLNGAGTRCASATLEILEANEVRPTIAATVADNATLLALVAAGHGVTIAPSLLLQNLPHGVILSTEDFEIERTLFAVARRASGAPVAALVDAIRRSSTA